jgi:anti-sigma regulatory factor (Ser/Thr protein kinase)
VHLVFSAMDKVIHFERIFSYREYLQFLRDIEEFDAPANIELDLRRISFAHATGLAPVVATIRHLTNLGWSFDVVLPQDDFIADYFTKAGWVAGITGAPPPRFGRGKSYLPLSTYRSHDELNPLVTEMIDHLASTTPFEAGVIDAIAWSLNEIADNVLLHAGPDTTGWVQMVDQPKKSLIELVIVDSGRGITSSLRQAFPDLEDDREALMKAVEKGVTRDPNVGQGNGLAGTVRIANAAGGWANLHSGRGQLRLMPDKTYCEMAPFHQGTLVEVTLPTDKPIDVAEALWGHQPMSEFEMRYLDEGGHGIHVLLTAEATGFGNRASAKPVRIKIRNLLTQYPTEILTIDFEGVTLISASFADELVARLVKEIGTTGFFARVRLTNLSELARRTIDAVIAQRLASP